MSTPQWINIETLPHLEGSFSNLYRDYIGNFKNVQHYFEADFHSFQQIPRLIERRGSQIQRRDILVEVLTRQNQLFGGSEKTLSNIRLLADEKTFAVVTGQQVGIFGGPLYTIYKIITALKLTAQLQEQFSGYTFVPVFWLEGEDHDIDEVTKVGIFNTEHAPATIQFTLDNKPPEKNIGPVGEIAFGNAIDNFFQQLQNTLGNSEFKQPLMDFLKKSYTPESTFNTAFAKLINQLFDGSGLICISVNDKQFKQLLSPIFQKEIREYPRVSQLVIDRSAQLEERYHAQIKTKALNLFYFHKGGRYFIEPREHDFSLRGTRHFIPKDELLRVGIEQPELLSPNVALRPICQDAILPTIAYVAGPSEVAYFAQLKEVYQYFQLTMPMIYPRATATIVEERLEKILGKYELGVEDVFRNPDQMNKKVLGMISEINIDEMFSSALQRIIDQTNEMKFGINQIDPTLLNTLDATRAKIESHFAALKEKVSAAQQQKHETALRQIERVTNTVFPNKNFQERELSVIHFMNKHGLDFVRWLQNEIQIGQFQHQLIRL